MCFWKHFICSFEIDVYLVRPCVGVQCPFGPLYREGEAAFSPLTFSYTPHQSQRYLKSGAITLNSIRRAVGVPEQDDEGEEEESEDEEEEEVVAKKKPAAKKAKTTPPAATKSGGKKGAKPAAAAAEPERRSSGVFGFISNLFSPSKK